MFSWKTLIVAVLLSWVAGSLGIGMCYQEGDLMDCAGADAEAELQVRLHQTDGRLVKAIEDALMRIPIGTFGVCGACKHPIPKARLEAVPWTRLCRNCKEQSA